MKLGSLFDGSGGFPLAGSLCGIEPVWAAEIEPYPIAVTRSRFPNMKHLGDISKVNGADIEPVDVITFGSPCQDLSVAGKRAGLKHEDNGDEETTRSGLFMEAVRIIREMREATHGVYPRFALWENVPGAFSSNKGEDFRIVLEELSKIVETEAEMPPVPEGGWAYADCYMGDGWSLAYRVFDAQYWGVPQRRRRIYLVADFAGQCAGEILFERDGLRGYFAQGRTPWQAVTADAQGCAGADDRTGNGVICRVVGAAGFCPEQSAKTRGIGYEVEESPTLRAGVTPAVCIKEVLPFDTTQVTSPMNYSNPKWGDPCHPLAAGAHHPAVVVRTWDARGNGDGITCNTITGDHNNRITDYTSCVCYAMQAFGKYQESNVASAMKARDYKDATDLVVECAGVDCRNFTESPELYPTLQAKSNGGQSLNYSGAVRIQYIVRRLTPTECARLQGFADGWGIPDHKDSFAPEEYKFWLEVRNTHAEINGKMVKNYTEKQMLAWYNKLHTDSSEYKMWGNGIALPTALYVMQGIEEALRR